MGWVCGGQGDVNEEVRQEALLGGMAGGVPPPRLDHPTCHLCTHVRALNTCLPLPSFLPARQALKARWHLPYGAVVHPLAEAGGEVPVAQQGSTIIRCKRCRTYMNPFMVWMDGGR